MFNYLSISKRLMALSAIPLLFLIIFVVSAVITFSTIQSSVQTIYNDRVVPLEQLKSISDLYAVNMIDAVNKANAGMITVEEAKVLMQKASIEIRRNWQLYIQTELTEQEAIYAKEATGLFKLANHSVTNALLELDKYKGNVRNQLANLDGPMYEQIDPITNKLSELISLQLEVALEEKLTVERLYEKVLFFYILGALLSFILTIIFSWLLYKSINISVTSIKQDIGIMVSEQKLDMKVRVYGEDEIAQIGYSINGFLEGLSQSFSEILQMATGMLSSAKQLEHVASNTSMEILNQREEVDKIVIETKEMSKTVDNISASASFAQSSAFSTKELASDGKLLVESAKNAVSELNIDMNEVNNKIQILQKKSKEIGSVIMVINNIAEQTNLLALNAAIEAARAGDKGRGFAVVADEVRALAQNTQSSTKEITSVITALQQGTQEAVEAIHRCKNIAKSADSEAEQAVNSLYKIDEAVMQITQMNKDITDTATLQGEMAVNINSSVEKMLLNAKNAERNANSSTEHTNLMNEKVNRMLEMITVFKLPNLIGK